MIIHAFPPLTVVLATRNPGKVRELMEPLQAYGISVIGLDALPDMPEVEETGTTFTENALLKAHTVAVATGLVSVADDSGLEVDALNGAPGVYSARYSEDMPQLPGATKDERNNMKLIAALSSVPLADRSGRFQCVMAACAPNNKHVLATGTWEGRLLSQPRGQGGFGYDPLFFDPDLGRTAAQLSREEKMQHSHRSRALKRLLDLWPAFWDQNLPKPKLSL